MGLELKFKEIIERRRLFSAGDRLLLAVSGGLDSVVLCELCKRAGFSFLIAHCNFQLREKESERDEDFVRKLAADYNVDFELRRFETDHFASERKLSVQVAARELRYSWFKELIKEKKADWILTAHHADDNIETVLMNFFKGTGISGLRGIPEKNDRIVRPLLGFRKSDLLSFGKTVPLQWVEDSSNASDKYNRNYFRNQLIPLISQLYPKAEENILSNIHRLGEVEMIYHQAIEQYKKSLIEARGSEYFIPILKLAKQTPLNTIVFELVRDFGFSPAQSNEIIRLFGSESGKFVQSATHRILRHRKWLVITPIVPSENSIFVIEKEDQQVDAGSFTLSVVTRRVDVDNIKSSADIAQLDLKTINFPLILRKSKPGDYFYPLGMKKKKKLSRFFIDQKLSKSDKENVWVIESGKRIAWVIGHRIDDRFKLSPQTQSALVLTNRNK